MSETCRYSERIHMYKKGKEDHRFLGGKRKPVRMQCVVDIRTVGIKFTRGSLVPGAALGQRPRVAWVAKATERMCMDPQMPMLKLHPTGIALGGFRRW